MTTSMPMRALNTTVESHTPRHTREQQALNDTSSRRRPRLSSLSRYQAVANLQNSRCVRKEFLVMRYRTNSSTSIVQTP